MPALPPSPRRTGRPPALEAAAIPDRLLDAATALFTRQGYANTTMEAIAKQAGASSKTVYSRYANKAEVLAGVAKRLMDRALAESEGRPPRRARGGDPRAVLNQFGREIAALSEAGETAGLNRLILAEGFQAPALARLFVELHERASALVRGSLEDWAKQGRMRRLPPPGLAAPVFVEMVASMPRIRAMLGMPLSRRERDAHVKVAVDLFLRGCGYEEEGQTHPASQEESRHA